MRSGIIATLTMAALIPCAQAQEWRATVEQYWIGKGFTVAAAEGIADQATKESGGNPTVIGDGGSSLGLFQHHSERMDQLLLRIENDQAFAELMGSDPAAAAHFNELKNARSRADASRIWQQYFERPKGRVVAKDTRVRPQIPVAQKIPEIAAPATASLDPFSAESGDATSSFLITNAQ